VPDVPAEFQRIVTKALMKDRDERYRVIEDLASDLKSLKHDLEFEAEPERTGSRKVIIDGGTTAETILDAASLQTDAANELNTTHNRADVDTKRNRHRRVPLVVLAVLIAVIALAAITSFVYSKYHNQPDKTNISHTTGIRSIAVLPFANVNGNPDTEYLSEGISESLINSLSQLPQLKIIARSSSFKYKGKDADPETVAKALGVEAILTGRVTPRGENLLISVELMDARDRMHVWGAEYNRKAADLLQMPAEISKEIAEQLRLRLSMREQQQLTKRETVNAQAYELLLRGVSTGAKGARRTGRKLPSIIIRRLQLILLIRWPGRNCQSVTVI
jgi:TolB-like protein